MKHLAAYLLLGLGGNASPSAADVKKVLSCVGIEADDERLNKLISELEGKDINEVRHSTAGGSSVRSRFKTRMDTDRLRSSSPLVPRSWPPSPLAVPVVPPPLAVLPLVALLPTPLPRRRRRRRRSPTRIWVSVCSTKRFLTRISHGYDTQRQLSGMFRAGYAAVLACLWRGRICCSWTGLRAGIRPAF